MTARKVTYSVSPRGLYCPTQPPRLGSGTYDPPPPYHPGPPARNGVIVV